MRIVWYAPEEQVDHVPWPEGWPPPRVGDTIWNAESVGMRVTSVEWFPAGEAPNPEPFVHVVLRR